MKHVDMGVQNKEHRSECVGKIIEVFVGRSPLSDK